MTPPPGPQAAPDPAPGWLVPGALVLRLMLVAALAVALSGAVAAWPNTPATQAHDQQCHALYNCTSSDLQETHRNGIKCIKKACRGVPRTCSHAACRLPLVTGTFAVKNHGNLSPCRLATRGAGAVLELPFTPR